MKFSIIIPVHNARERIDTIINRLKVQTFKDFEAIFVCDACTDGSFEYIAKTYPEAKVIETNYGNDGLARSTGLDVATAEWVMFMDDDDDWTDEFVLSILDAYTIRYNFDILCCAFDWKHVGLTSPWMDEENSILWSNVWSKVWRRSAIGNTRFPNKYPDSDLYFTREMLAKSEIKVIATEFCFYRYNYLREGSISWKEAQKKNE